MKWVRDSTVFAFLRHCGLGGQDHSDYRLVGLVVKASASRAGDPRFESRLCWDFFGVESYQWPKNWHSSDYPCQAPGVIGSVLGLIGPVSVYCDWLRWKVWPATSVSVWQHVKLPEQVRPWDTLAYCWDIKQPTNKQTLSIQQTTKSFRLTSKWFV